MLLNRGMPKEGAAWSSCSGSFGASVGRGGDRQEAADIGRKKMMLCVGTEPPVLREGREGEIGSTWRINGRGSEESWFDPHLTVLN